MIFFDNDVTCKIVNSLQNSYMMLIIIRLTGKKILI